MKLTLINPPWYHFEENGGLFSFNLGIGYISSYLKSKGHEVHIIDALFGEGSNNCIKVNLKYQTVYRIGKSFEQIIKEIPKNSDYIGITAPFSNHLTIIKELSEKIKEKIPAIPIIIGGLCASASPEQVLTKAVDYAIIGEGEIPLEKFLNGENPKKIKGFVFRKDGRIINNGMAEFITDLDVIPFLDIKSLHYNEILSSLKLDKIRKGSEIIEVKEKGFPILTSRGCPYDCHFCSIHQINGYRWRFRSAENILKEIKAYIQEYAIDSIAFQDDMLTADIERFKKILDGLIKLRSKYKKALSWSCPNGIRIDHLNEELIKKIKESGCSSLVLGVQSGDPEMLKIMNTKLDLTKVEETIKLCNKYTVPTAGFLVFGYPGETRKSFFKSLRYAQKLYQSGMKEFRINLARVYLNTKMHMLCKNKGYLVIKDIENLVVFPKTDSEANLITPEFNPKELIWRREFAQKHLMSYENYFYWKLVYYLERFGLKEWLKHFVSAKQWGLIKNKMFKLLAKIDF